MAKASTTGAVDIQPLSDRVLVRRESMPTPKSAAGIIIPDTAKQEKSKRGIVIAVGPGRMADDGKLVPMNIKPGASVVFNAGWDNEVEVQGETDEYFLVRESDILAVIK